MPSCSSLFSAPSTSSPPVCRPRVERTAATEPEGGRRPVLKALARRLRKCGERAASALTMAAARKTRRHRLRERERPARDRDNRCAFRTMSPQSGRSRGRRREFSLSPLPVSWTTNHSGKRHAPMPLAGAQGSLGAAGGACNLGDGISMRLPSTRVNRGSIISSRPLGQVSSPPVIAACFGRSIRAPGRLSSRPTRLVA